jgi:DNA processing protein
MIEAKGLDLFSEISLSPLDEMAAYEAIWARPGTTFKKLADFFKQAKSVQLSNEISPDELISYRNKLLYKLEAANIKKLGIRINNTFDYPKRLRDARNPVEMFYYRGNWELIESPRTVAIVGSRQASLEGIKRAQKLTKLLVKEGYTIVSGLAKGIDTAAHTTAIQEDGNTVAVIGTPITESYPKENSDLQELIARNHLLISQVPIVRYSNQDYRRNRIFFPERNALMSALTKATIIVEAGETSGSLIQAREALYQGRKLFILDNCFRNPSISWPKKYEEKGAIRVKDISDILLNLSNVE